MKMKQTMKTDKTPVAGSQVMELRDMISGPLMATIDADSIATRRYLQHLMEFAFDQPGAADGTAGELRKVSFVYDSVDVGGSRKQRVSIPLLSLVPLPLLQVSRADFDFDIRIVDAVPREPENNLNLLGVESDAPPDVALRVAMADGTSNSLDSNMKVHVEMRQADMPGGLSKFLNMAAGNVSQEDYEKPQR